MTDLSDYELRVLRQMATSGDEDLICGYAFWVAVETLEKRGLIEARIAPDSVFYSPTETGRALVAARDTELTETKNV